MNDHDGYYEREMLMKDFVQYEFQLLAHPLEDNFIFWKHFQIIFGILKFIRYFHHITFNYTWRIL